MNDQLAFHPKMDQVSKSQDTPRNILALEKTNILIAKLREKGLDFRHASEIATITDHKAMGAISHQDWMQLEPARFSPQTKEALESEGIDVKNIIDDKQAEHFAACVIEHEGMPDGNGRTERICGRAVQGQFDNANHGIDLVAANEDGVPVLLEVKKYSRTSAVHLTDKSLTGGNTPIEPEVQKLAKIRRREELLTSPRFDKPSDIRQMNDLWVRDRWLKLIKSEDGVERLKLAGVDEKFLNYQNMRNMNSFEWNQIMDNRKIVLVGGKGEDISDYLLSQVIFENRAKMVFKIDIGTN